MGKRALPVKPPRPVLRVLLMGGGLVCLLAGALWILFFLAMLLFGGLDLGERVGSGYPMKTQGFAIVSIGLLGLVPLSVGRMLMSRSSGR